MESDSKKPSKPRLRFNFSGQNEKRKTAENTRDEILDSLNKYAHPQDKPLEGEVGQGAEPVDSTHINQSPVPSNLPGTAGKGHAGRLAFLVFIGGSLAVWVYGCLTAAYDVPFLSAIVQNEGVQVGIQTVSRNPFQAAFASASVFLGALYAWHRRRSPS